MRPVNQKAVRYLIAQTWKASTSFIHLTSVYRSRADTQNRSDNKYTFCFIVNNLSESIKHALVEKSDFKLAFAGLAEMKRAQAQISDNIMMRFTKRDEVNNADDLNSKKASNYQEYDTTDEGESITKEATQLTDHAGRRFERCKSPACTQKN